MIAVCSWPKVSWEACQYDEGISTNPRALKSSWQSIVHGAGRLLTEQNMEKTPVLRHYRHQRTCEISMNFCILASFLVYIPIFWGPGPPRLLAYRHIRSSSPFLGKTLFFPELDSREDFRENNGSLGPSNTHPSLEFTLAKSMYSRKAGLNSHWIPERNSAT